MAMKSMSCQWVSPDWGTVIEPFKLDRFWLEFSGAFSWL